MKTANLTISILLIVFGSVYAIDPKPSQHPGNRFYALAAGSMLVGFIRPAALQYDFQQTTGNF